jgi:acetoacetyl-CoA synthetase
MAPTPTPGTSAQTPLWEPTEHDREQSEMTRFMRWAGERHGRKLADYAELWAWSVSETERFWADIWEFCGIRASRPYEQVLDSHQMPGARWFAGAQLNYAENLLGGGREVGVIPIKWPSCTHRSCAS